MSNFEILQQGILSMSESQVWEDALDEWNVVDLRKSPTAHTCLCTKTPIINLCYLENKYTGSKTIVGNCCVKNFLGQDYTAVFSGIQRIKQNPQAYGGNELLDWCYKKNALYFNQLKKYKASYRKHDLGEAENKFSYAATREKANRQMLSFFNGTMSDNFHQSIKKSNFEAEMKEKAYAAAARLKLGVAS